MLSLLFAVQKFHTIDGRRCEVKKAMSKIMMKNKICASVLGGGNNGGGGGQQGWNGNSFWGPGNYEALRGGMCGNGGGLMNVMGGGGSGRGGMNGNDYSMPQGGLSSPVG